MREPGTSEETGPSWAEERAAREQAEALAWRLARLQAATSELSGARTPDEVAAVALDAGLAALGGTKGFVVVAGPDGALDLLRCAGLAEEAVRAVARAAVPTPTQEAWRTGEPVFVEGPEDFARRFASSRPLAERCRYAGNAIAALPLLASGRTLGVLVIGFPSPRRFGSDERAFAAAVAGQCGQALDRARLFHAERVARAEAVAAQGRLLFLDELSASLAGAPGEAEILERVVQLTVPALADWAGAFTRGDGGAAVLVAEAGSDPLGVAARALVEAEPLSRLLRSAAGDAAAAVEGLPRSPIRAAAVVPVVLGGHRLGALVAASADPVRTYGAADLLLLAEAGRRAALAIERARALREARAAARAREEFLQVASHELRGPIGTLRLAVQLLRRDQGRTAEQLEARLGLVERQAERLVELSDALLDVSRITAGRLELHREPGDLAAVAREVVARLADDALEARSPVEVEAPAPVRLAFDAARLEQVIANLLSNALKYGRGAPVTVAARAAGGRAVLEVRDRGIGIAPADQARIFERFERAVSSRHHAGLGLGLWIVRQIVEAHGGEVRVASAPGCGATFTVELPAGGAAG